MRESLCLQPYTTGGKSSRHASNFEGRCAHKSKQANVNRSRARREGKCHFICLQRGIFAYDCMSWCLTFSELQKNNYLAEVCQLTALCDCLCT